MIDETFVDLSRFQFAMTVMYHFIFVPLTLGLSWILFMMEAVYVMTGKQIYKDMTKFWGKLFGINFALGITTGLTMEFQFGTNWSYYSHYVGDVFGAPLAIEGLMAFFLESTFAGMFFMGWDRLSKVQHLMATFLLALGTNLSALWILVANGWMQLPVGAEFSVDTMRMEMVNFIDIIFSPVAQAKFIHTIAAGYVAAAMFVMGVSSYYILRGRDLGFARRSFAVAVGFGFASILSVLVLGDESGYTVGHAQRTKLAVIEAEYETQKAPASFTVFGIPNEETMDVEHAIRIPWALGLIATRSLDKPVMGIRDIVLENEARIKEGVKAYGYMERIRGGDKSLQLRGQFEDVKEHLGYGLLLKRYIEDPAKASPEMIKKAAREAIPRVTPMFWSFRLMVGLGIYMLALITIGFYYTIRRKLDEKRWFLKTMLWSIPAPWIAIELGWFVAEYGRQPWAINDVLPTFLAVSNLTTADLIFSITCFFLLYTAFLIIEMWLMVKFVKQGPSSLKTGRYHFEKSTPQPAYPAAE